jgi:hypothetical protein
MDELHIITQFTLVDLDIKFRARGLVRGNYEKRSAVPTALLVLLAE